ncbi:toprim domain-containing protein [Anoxybacteroides amylolyticum]|uniref:Toprim domain protein n=1 Tax=Anoxybacteroides amylolyticum TaxID=294699 RepID=A0A160F2N4_9BACL|nr:toprim domain-containing protein [Anoxybacillus amylolyticus]ANB60507.1 toprim domain protein [Anoxybacillus amylolyticus]
MTDSGKVIIVEGRSDKKKIENLVKEPIEIICTNGTISRSKLDEWSEALYNKEVFILVDADEAGERLRKQLRREFPEAEHLYIDRTYREVAAAPKQHIAMVLLGANIDVHVDDL